MENPKTGREREPSSKRSRVKLGLAPAIAAWRGDLGGEALAGWRRLAQRRCVGRGRGCSGLVAKTYAVVPIARLLQQWC